MSTGWWAEYHDRFGLDVPVDIGMQSGGYVVPGEIGLTLTPSVGMTATHSYARQFGLDVPVAIGLERRAPTPGSFGLDVPVTIGPLDYWLPQPLLAFSDDFNRADATTLGPNWDNRSVAGDSMGIRSNRAYPYSAYGNRYPSATWITPLATDGQKVSARFRWTVLPTNAVFFLWFASSPTLQCLVLVIGGATGPTLRIGYCSNWAPNTSTFPVTNTTVTVKDGDEISMDRAGSSTVIRARINGVAVCTWDAGGVLPIPGGRLLGIGGQSLQSGADWDDWAAADINTPDLACYYDSFTRANSTANLGSAAGFEPMSMQGGRWVARTGVLGIRSNQAYGVSGNNAVATWSRYTNIPVAAYFPAPLNTDNQRVSATIANPTGSAHHLWIACPDTGQCPHVAVLATSLQIRTATDWNPNAGFTARATYTGTVSDGDRISIERAPGSTVFVAKQNGLTRVTWDGAGVVTKDADNRLVGIGCYSGQASNWDDWLAEDII